MPITVPATELKQRTGQVLDRAVLRHEDIVIERYGREYAVVVSRERYQELLDASKARVRDRFLAAQKTVHRSTEDVDAEEIARIVEETVQESRRARAGLGQSPDEV